MGTYCADFTSMSEEYHKAISPLQNSPAYCRATGSKGNSASVALRLAPWTLGTACVAPKLVKTGRTYVSG